MNIHFTVTRLKSLFPGFLLLCYLLIGQSALAQNPHWLLQPEELTFTQNGLTSTSTGPSPASTPYISSNAAYDESGTLLFYVEDEDLYDPTGTSVGFVGTGLPNGEVAIIPKPGSCDQYYVIRWGSAAFIGLNLTYQTVTVSGASVTISSNTTLRTAGFLHIGGVAVSDPDEVTMDRMLYAIASPSSGGQIVTRYKVSSSGITFDQVILHEDDLDGMTLEYDPPEAELAGNCFAWGSVFDNRLWVVVFNIGSGNFQEIREFTLPEGLTCGGLEFADRGTKLYVSACGEEEGMGIYYFDVTAPEEPPVQVMIEGDETYNCTHIEKATDDLLYLVSDSDLLSELDINSNIISVSPLNLSVVSNSGTLSGTFYTLPDQADDDDYSSFTGFPAAYITALDINGENVDPALATLPEFFSCNSLMMNASGDAIEHRIVLLEQVGASFVQQYQSGWGPGFPTATNLASIPSNPGNSGNPTFLQTNTGDFLVQLMVRNECEVIKEEEGEFRLSDPGAVSLDPLSLNTVSLPTSISVFGQSPPSFFECEALDLDVVATGAEYRIKLFASYGDGNQAPGLDYLSAWIAAPIPATVDLTSLFDNAGLNIQSPGTYGVEVEVRDECLSSTPLLAKGYFQISGSPTPISITLEFSPVGTPPMGGLQAASQVSPITTPLIGGASGSFDLASTSGFFTYYEVKYIKEVNCTTGNEPTPAVNVPVTAGQVPLTSPGGLQNIGLNAITYDGTYGYFNNPANSVVGKCYEVEIAVGNPCGEVTTWSYFKIDGNYRIIPGSNDVAFGSNQQETSLRLRNSAIGGNILDEPNEFPVAFKLFPNPTQGQFSLTVEGLSGGELEVSLFDATGREVWRTADTSLRGSTKNFDISHLPTGVYIWKGQVGELIEQGRLIKR